MNFMNKQILSRHIQKNKQNIEANIRSHAFMEEKYLLEDLYTTNAGLTSEEAEKRQDSFGKNVITVGNKNTVFHRLRDSVINPFNIVLLIIAAIIYFTDVIASPNPDFFTVIVILSLVLLSSSVAFVQTQRSNTAAVKNDFQQIRYLARWQAVGNSNR